MLTLMKMFAVLCFQEFEVSEEKQLMRFVSLSLSVLSSDTVPSWTVSSLMTVLFYGFWYAAKWSPAYAQYAEPGLALPFMCA